MTQTELDRLIAMLEPQADSDAVEFVRNEIGRLLRGAYTNEYVPRSRFDLPIADAEVNTPSKSHSERSPQQAHDVYEVNDWNPNDPRNW